MDEKTGHILIVEDELIVAHSIQMRLELHGYAIDGIAKSGEEALQLLESVIPDLILMDIRLSGEIDGIDAAERIRRDHQIPVIFLTAYSDDQTLARAKITEPFGYIIKPFETRELVNNIEIALYRQKMSAALQASEARFRGLFENAVIGLVLLDHEDSVVEANRAITELLGYDEKRALLDSDALETLVHASFTQTGTDLESGVGSIHPRAELSIRRRDGTDRLLQITSTEIPKAPKSPPFTALFVEDITDLRQFESDLQERQLALRALFVNEEVIREHERTSLSRDIHDVLGQMLTAHKMDLHWMKSRGLAGETESTVNEMLEHMDEMIQFVKRVCSELRDSVLDDFGFDVALDEHLKQFEERSKTRVEMKNTCGEFAFNRDKAVSLLRIIQEALTNITRHAQASTVTIGCRRDGDLMIWTIVDNGIGFDASAGEVHSSLGIVGMNERAAAWGGQVEISSVAGHGTTVRVEVPFDQEEDIL
ncbi:MAG TPA: response regulator [Spirochaetia bacterium]|nr:response regulator [Spirochaetia bacterium]